MKGSFGNFIKWNYTKFLVAGDGTPIKRYGPKEAPFSFEKDIVKLLEVKGACDSSVTDCFDDEEPASANEWQTAFEQTHEKLEEALLKITELEEERDLLRMQLDQVTLNRDN